MPEIRYYTVTQERQVKVWANTPFEAALVANAAFQDVVPGDVPGAVLTPIRDLDIVAREDY